jgi:hypothetical protein
LLTIFEQTPKPRLSLRQKPKAAKVLSTPVPKGSRRAARNERITMEWRQSGFTYRNEEMTERHGRYGVEGFMWNKPWFGIGSYGTFENQ